jgi:hypothetical protein
MQNSKGFIAGSRDIVHFFCHCVSAVRIFLSSEEVAVGGLYDQLASCDLRVTSENTMTPAMFVVFEACSMKGVWLNPCCNLFQPTS